MNPPVRPGAVVQVAAADWRYGEGDLVLRVERIRAELSRYYGGEWLWLEGHRLTAVAEPTWVQALVRTAALPVDPALADAIQARIH